MDKRKILLEIFKKVLERDDIEYSDDFFKCGGDSISAITVILELKNHPEIKLSVIDLYENRSIDNIFKHQI